MKHKILLFTLTLSMAAAGLYAQSAETTNKPKKKWIHGHQVGVNAAPFLDRYLKLNNTTNQTVSPYLFSYRMMMCKHSALRFALGVNADHESLEASSTSVPRKSSTKNFDVGLGYEYFLLDQARWKAGAGLMFVMGNRDSTADETDFQGNRFLQKDISSYSGAALSLSVQYYISKRVALGSDAGLYFVHTINKLETSVSGQFPQNSYSTSKHNLITPAFPVSLFILFSF